MTGFANIEAGVEHFFEHLAGDIDADVKSAATLLKPLITAVAATIKAQGLPLVESAVATIATAAAGALAGTETKSAAGTAAIAAVKTAGIDLGEDALHALTTAALVTPTTA